MNLPEGTQFGFVAQEFEKSFPDLVKASFHPYEESRSDSPEGQGVAFKAINYTGLIPVMVSAMQEQQRTIEEQNETTRSLEERLSALEARMSVAPTDEEAAAENSSGSEG